MSLTALSAAQLLSLLDSGETTSVDIVNAFADRIEAYDQRVGAFLSVQRQAALEAAEAIDRRRAGGERLGLLGGLPVAVKDVLCTRDLETTCGSRMLERFRPPYDATVIERLRAADGVVLGKTNMDEFAMGSSTENSALQATRNPWDLDFVPGGSSGGAAACLAAAMAPLSLGSDTGGSIRQPAAYCGVVGLKPTYGRVSRYGLVAFASSLDQVGPLAHTAEDTALLLEAIAGHDPLDSTSAPVPTEPYREQASRPLEGLRIGVVRDHFEAGLDSEVERAVREALKVLQDDGAELIDVSLPHSKYGIAVYYVIAPSEASSNLARYDGVHYGYRTDEAEMRAAMAAEREKARSEGGEAAVKQLDTALVKMYRRTRSEGFGPEVKRRMMLGAYALSHGYYDKYYLKALQVRRLIRNDYDEAFGEVDLIAGPVTPTTAYRLGEKTDDPLSMYLGDLYTVPANLAGVASLSTPCGFAANGLPIGLQLQAPSFAEAKLLQTAQHYQQLTDWPTRCELT